MSDNDHHNIENEAEAESAQVQFLELLKWEEESKVYLEQLEKEENEVREAVDAAIKENHTLREFDSTLEAKVQAQLEGRASLGVEECRQRENELREESQKIRDTIDSMRMGALNMSTNFMGQQLQDTAQLENVLKEYRSQPAVNNAINTKKVQTSQIRSHIHEFCCELNIVNAAMEIVLEQRKLEDLFNNVVIDSKKTAEGVENEVASLARLREFGNFQR